MAYFLSSLALFFLKFIFVSLFFVCFFRILFQLHIVKTLLGVRFSKTYALTRCCTNIQIFAHLQTKPEQALRKNQSLFSQVKFPKGIQNFLLNNKFIRTISYFLNIILFEFSFIFYKPVRFKNAAAHQYCFFMLSACI